jgi:hypothetical protein
MIWKWSFKKKDVLKLWIWCAFWTWNECLYRMMHMGGSL